MGRRRRIGWRIGWGAVLVFVVAVALLGGARLARSGDEPMMLPDDSTTTKPSAGLPSDSYVAEVVDSTFFVGPAEFFALDLPTTGPGIEATHLSGTVTAVKGDIIVRLFSGIEYDRWLKKRGGPVAKPFYVSSKARTINLQNDLAPGQAAVLLLDNGYSIRTPKRVHCQLQIEYRRLGGAAGSGRSGGTTASAPKTPTAGDDVVPTPRSNDDDQTPPPPPPPDESGK